MLVENWQEPQLLVENRESTRIRDVSSIYTEKTVTSFRTETGFCQSQYATEMVDTQCVALPVSGCTCLSSSFSTDVQPCPSLERRTNNLARSHFSSRLPVASRENREARKSSPHKLAPLRQHLCNGVSGQAMVC